MHDVCRISVTKLKRPQQRLALQCPATLTNLLVLVCPAAGVMDQGLQVCCFGRHRHQAARPECPGQCGGATGLLGALHWRRQGVARCAQLCLQPVHGTSRCVQRGSLAPCLPLCYPPSSLNQTRSVAIVQALSAPRHVHVLLPHRCVPRHPV